MDRDVVELQGDDSNIDKEVSESCEFTSTIYECIVELESVLAAKEALEKPKISLDTSICLLFRKRGNFVSKSTAKNSGSCQITKARTQEILLVSHRMVSVFGIPQVWRSQECKPV